MHNKILLALVALFTSAAAIHAQAPAQTVVQSAIPVTAPAAAQAAPAGQAPAQAAASLALLLQVKAANEATIEKQTVTLRVLEEMEKTAEQIKIYTKRG